MSKFAVIIPYFGTFKPSIVLFLESCNRNPRIDWHIFTDCNIPEGITLNSNVKWHTSTLETISSLVNEKLGFQITMSRAYKLCDLKPFYGLLFSDYLNCYEYWGYGDTDVIYGNVVSYLEKINYSRYDKINWMGHLCFIRNQQVCNEAVLKKIPGTIDAETVLLREDNLGFDERDFNRKWLASGMTIHTGKWAADIDIHYWRMRCADLGTFHILLNTKEIKYAPKNYRNQIFALLDGNIYRIYLKGNRVHFEEFAYIHFRKEVPILLDDIHTSSYLFSRDGFLPLHYNEKQLHTYQIVRNLIDAHNNQEKPWQELLSFLYYVRRRYFKK